MSRLYAAVLLGSAVVMLVGGCDSAGSSAVSTTSAVIPAANSSTGSGSGSASASASASASQSSGGGGDGRQPCSRPATMNGFLKLDSAGAAQGGTLVDVTIVNCSVDPANDEDVEYAPVSSSSLLIPTGAQVQVLAPSNNLEAVSGSWLVSHQVVNTPYFYYQENAEHQITAMQEIYRP